MKKISIPEIMKIFLKDNRILHIGIGFLLISISMYIINNFIKIPSFGLQGTQLFPNGVASSGGVNGGDRRIFIQNY